MVQKNGVEKNGTCNHPLDIPSNPSSHSAPSASAGWPAQYATQEGLELDGWFSLVPTQKRDKHGNSLVGTRHSQNDLHHGLI